MAEAALLLAKQRKNAYRLNANNLMETMQGYLKSGSKATEAQYMVSIKKLKDYQDELTKLDNEILITIAKEDELGDAIAKSAELSDLITEHIVLAEMALTKMRKPASSKAEHHDSSSQSFSFASTAAVKLPKLEIKKYDGNPLAWQEFWDSFRNTIHEHKELSPVEKFKYLKQYLKGAALGVAEGYPLSDKTYDQVVEALFKRFGDPELAIFSHLDAMISLAPASNDIADIQRVVDDCEIHIRCLVCLGMEESTFGRVFTPIIISKLPVFIRVELYRQNGPKAWTLDNLRTILHDELSARQMSKKVLGEASGKQDPPKKPPHPGIGPKNFGKSSGGGTATILLNNGAGKSKGPTPRYPCMFCKTRGHFSDQCGKFPDVASRKSQIKGYCYICLKSGHGVRDCTSKDKECTYCKEAGKHHRSLCPSKFGNGPPGPVNSSGKPGSSKDPPDGDGGEAGSFITTDAGLVSQNSGANRRGGIPVMPTALVVIRGKKGSERVRVLFDKCSTRSFCRNDVLKRIGAEHLRVDRLSVVGIEAEKRQTKNYSCCAVTMLDRDGEGLEVSVNALKSISCPIKRQFLDPNDFPELRKLTLADPLEHTHHAELHMLIGLDYYYDLVGPEELRLERGLVLANTRFGYIASGFIQDLGPTSQEDIHGDAVMFASSENTDESLDRDLVRLWELEDVGIKADLASGDQIAQEKFDNTVTFDDQSGRYLVTWPYKEDSPNLPSNYGLARGRLGSLLRRIDKSTLTKYDAIINEQLEKGVIELAPETPDSDLVHYLPHHCVIREDKATTKVRIVYDASSKKSKTDLSLNDCLYRGPVYLADLCGLLMRFRAHLIGMVSDIEKAFLQIGLQRTERDVTRFIWLKDPAKGLQIGNIVHYRFTRVMFGVISSPFLLAATVRHHLKKEASAESIDILRNIYVDNLINGRDSDIEARRYFESSVQVFSAANMNLREWYSNSQVLMESLPGALKGEKSSTSVLGLQWDTRDDTLSCIPSKNGGFSLSKRDILRQVAAFYDPCGYFSPITIRGKMLIQVLWQDGYSWDEVLPDNILEQWYPIAADLELASGFALSRYQSSLNRATSVQLHCFCDASEKAYGIAVYVRFVVGDQVVVHLTFWKARVSPAKRKLTIPKLELTALSIGCPVTAFVQKELGTEAELFLWSDSNCALFWVLGNATSPVFVKNRVSRARNYPEIIFRYVPGPENPADLPSRGVSASKLCGNDLWLHGPSFLRKDPAEWPQPLELTKDNPEIGQDISDDEAEALIAAESVSETDHLFDPSRCSSLKKLLRVTAWVLRFTACVRRNRVRGNLTAHELFKAKMIWVRACQKQLVSGLHLPKNRALVQQHGLYLDKEGILRCSGKLDKSDLDFASKHPVFLRASDCPKFLELLIMSAHESIAHFGASSVVVKLRQEFWITRCQSSVKKVLTKCLVCRRVKGGPFQAPAAPPLPEFRSSQNEAFSCVGIDYLGPLYIKSLESTVKVWVCLFTCSRTRAIHLEVVSDMTASQFILALRRFMAVYRRPSIIVCDNAKQFTATKKTTDRIFWELCRQSEVRDFTAPKGITWKFIVEMAPWMGGFYERMVALVKSCLKCSIQNRKLTFIELQTVCCEISGILNSRPLTCVSEDFGDVALTPNHLITHTGPKFPILDTADAHDEDFAPEATSQVKLVAYWKRIQSVLNSFWDKWHRDYLVSLRGRKDPKPPMGSSRLIPTRGSVVLVHEKNLPRSQWRIGKIEALNESSDGEVRSAKVRLPGGGLMQRSLKHLYPLEVPPTLKNNPDPVPIAQPMQDGTAEESSRSKNLPGRLAAAKAQQKWRNQMQQLGGEDA